MEKKKKKKKNILSKRHQPPLTPQSNPDVTASVANHFNDTKCSGTDKVFKSKFT